jgi:peptidoglycan/LPS O-acetylase OafA/YrhL
VLFASITFGWFVLFADEYKQLGKHIAVGSGFISNFIFWNESGYFDNAAETKPLLHLWTLSIEEQFYIIWPLLLWGAWKRKFNLLTITVVVAIISFALNVKGIRSNAVATFYSPQTRFWELLTGSILAYFSLYKTHIFANYKQKLDMWLGAIVYSEIPEEDGSTLRNMQSFLGVTLIGVGTLLITKERHFPGTWALLPTLGTVLVISAGSQAWLNRTVLSNNILVWFGLISYPLYLWHWPLLSFAWIIESGMPSREIRIAAVLISILLAWLTYRYIETPIRKQKKTMTPLLLAMLMTVVGFLGFQTYISDGFPSRPIQTKLSFDIPKMGIERLASMRAPFCHLYKPDQTFSEYKLTIHTCLTLDPYRKNILVIGDSHALDLRMSLSLAYNNINFLQATGSGCTPIETIYNTINSRCGDLLRYIKYEYTELRKLDGIILTAKWDDRFALAIKDIKYFKSLGLPVVVFGPTYEFTDDVPKILSRNLSHKSYAKMLANYSILNRFSLDLSMESFFKDKKVAFVSKIQNFCVNGICPVLGDNNNLLILDSSHWTKAGAMYFGKIFSTNHALEKTLFID